MFLQYEAQHEWEKMHREHINVSRIIQQLKELLYQMDTLRAHVIDSDINQFDKLTANAQANIMNTIKEYMGKADYITYIGGNINAKFVYMHLQSYS